ncbi:hypothetical protein HI914_07037 [Erysiphe necator]|nr:hypothetical protein HI914_07037 [Erysiphe necator]
MGAAAAIVLSFNFRFNDFAFGSAMDFRYNPSLESSVLSSDETLVILNLSLDKKAVSNALLLKYTSKIYWST